MIHRQTDRYIHTYIFERLQRENWIQLLKTILHAKTNLRKINYYMIIIFAMVNIIAISHKKSKRMKMKSQIMSYYHLFE